VRVSFRAIEQLRPLIHRQRRVREKVERALEPDSASEAAGAADEGGHVGELRKLHGLLFDFLTEIAVLFVIGGDKMKAQGRDGRIEPHRAN
jgi:hypothetical protein